MDEKGAFDRDLEGKEVSEVFWEVDGANPHYGAVARRVWATSNDSLAFYY